MPRARRSIGRLSMRVSKRAAVALLAIAALADPRRRRSPRWATAAVVARPIIEGVGARRCSRPPWRRASRPPADPMLHGANPGGARMGAAPRRGGDCGETVAWPCASAVRSSLRPPGDGTPGPVMTVSASLYCGNDTTAVGTTPSVPISRSGNARMAGNFSLPAKCLAPVVLVHPNGRRGLHRRQRVRRLATVEKGLRAVARVRRRGRPPPGFRAQRAGRRYASTGSSSASSLRFG